MALLCVCLAVQTGRAEEAEGPEAGHVPGSGLGYDSGPQLGPRQLAWAALLTGLGLVAVGVGSGRPDMALFGGLLAPAGGVALWRDRGRRRNRVSRFSQAYDLTHFGEDMRYLFAHHPNRDMIALSLIRRYPELHRRFVFSLTAFGPPAEGPEGDFVRWYLGLAPEGTP